MGDTPFYVACKNGNLVLVKYLFEMCGVSPETPNAVRVRCGSIMVHGARVGFSTEKHHFGLLISTTVST